ncbi:vomeronasal type-2 receptor 26-like [Lissotriton helveticus]
MRPTGTQEQGIVSIRDLDTLAILEELRDENSTQSVLSKDNAIRAAEMGVTQVGEKSPFKPPSQFCPQLPTDAIDIFSDTVIQELQTLRTKEEKSKRKIKWNLPFSKRKAMQNLERDESIIIKPSDKGGNVVLQTRDNYCKEAKRQLHDKDNHAFTTEEDYNKSIQDYANLIYKWYGRGTLSREELLFLQNKHLKIPTFYHLPKVHKDATRPPLLHYIKNVKHTDERQIMFDASGNVLPHYDIVHWQIVEDGTMQHRLVGHYTNRALLEESLNINASALKWKGNTEVPISVCSSSCPLGFRKSSKQGEPTCCFQCVVCPAGEISNQSGSTECLKCPSDQWPNVRQDHCILKSIEFLAYEEALGAILGITSILLSLIPVAILGLFLYYRNTPIVKANNRSLSYLLLLSLALTFLSALAFIGYPTSEKCLVRQVAFGISFTLCVSCILAKTLMVVIAFRATKPNSGLKKWIGPHFSYIIIGLCTFFQTLLCVLWLIFSPPFSEYNTHTLPGKIIIECNEGSLLAFWCMLGYLGLLAFVSFIVAFFARKLPDSFNEAQIITFSMFAFLCVWLSFIPAYLSTRGKYTVALESFAILISSSALVSCLFLLKSYLILVKSERNTKHYLMGRDCR